MKRLIPFVMFGVMLTLCVLPAMAEEKPAEAPPPPKTPLERFKDRLDRIDASLRQANETMRNVLATLDWNAWNRGHDCYVRSVDRATAELSDAIAMYMIGVLDSGAQLDSPVLEAIDNAGNAVGLFAKHKARVNAYAKLTRRRVRYDKRRDALDYLGTLGVYELSEEMNDATGKILAPDSSDVIAMAQASPDGGLGPNPTTGCRPGTPEAGIALSKWQYAYMQAEMNIGRIAALETQVESLDPASRARPAAEEQVEAARAKQEELLEAIIEWRQKYYAAGGK